MSVVVAIKSENNIYIGADSQVTKGGTRSTLKNPNNYKIWKVGGIDHCLMAHVGAVRDACVVRLMDGLVTEYNVYKNHVDYEFVVKKVVPEIVDELKDYGMVKDDKFIDMLDSSFLFVYKNKLFLISRDRSVLEIDDYVAMGSGEDQAIGSLLSTEGQDPKERIVKAIKATAASDIYVDYPIIITDTKSTEFEIINEKDESKYLNPKKEGKEK